MIQIILITIIPMLSRFTLLTASVMETASTYVAFLFWEAVVGNNITSFSVYSASFVVHRWCSESVLSYNNELVCIRYSGVMLAKEP